MTFFIAPFALTAFPENVRTEMWTDQTDPTPAMATATKGETLIARVVERVSGHLQAMLDGQSVARVPPFFP